MYFKYSLTFLFVKALIIGVMCISEGTLIL